MAFDPIKEGATEVFDPLVEGAVPLGAGFSDVASPDNWPDTLPPDQREGFDALELDETQQNDMYDTVYFADAFGADPTEIDVFLPDIRKEFDFQPHKDNVPFDGRKRLSEAVKHGYRRGGIMMVKQLAGLAQQEVELGGRFRDWFWKKTPLGKPPAYTKGIERKLKEWSDMMLAGVNEYYRQYPEEAIQVAPELGFLPTLKEYVTKPENLIQAILESAPLMLEGILGAVTGGTAGAIALMGTPISGGTYAEARAEGTEPLPAMGQAMLTGYGEAAIESWTLSRKLGLLKGFKKLVQGGLPKILWEGTKAFFRGTAEEGSQEFNRNFWRWVFTDRSQDWLANVAESAAAGGPIEMVMAGGFAAAGAVATPVSKSQQTERVAQIRESVDKAELTDAQKAEINVELDQVAQDVENDVYVEEAVEPVAEPAKAPPKPSEAIEREIVAIEKKAATFDLVPFEGVDTGEIAETRTRAKAILVNPVKSGKVIDPITGEEAFAGERGHLEEASVIINDKLLESSTIKEVLAAQEFTIPIELVPDKQTLRKLLIEHEKEHAKINLSGLEYPSVFEEKLVTARAVKTLGLAPTPTAEVAKPKVKPKVPVTEIEARQKKLRQQIHAVAATKGLTKKALTELKKKHAGFATLTGARAVKSITAEQLESLLAAVRKARPKIIDHKKVLTKKQEKKISSLRENLIGLKQLTEADYVEVLKRETQGKPAKFIDAKQFITQKEAQAVIKRIHNQAEIARVVEPSKAAVRSKPEIAQQVDVINETINDKRAEMKRDPWIFESIRYYNEQMELKTGAPFFSLYTDMIDTHLETTKTRTARLAQLATDVKGFEAISKDEEALNRVSLYISSQSRLKTPVPKGITEQEIGMAKAIQKIFKEYEAKARWTRFYWWYITGKQDGAHPIGDYEQNKKAINKAVDIYEGKGKDAVIEYLKTQDWGVIKSGYEPLENIVQKVRLYKLKPTTVGKSHIEVRTAVEYHAQDRNILQRLGAYMRQIDMLNDLSPKINAYIQLFEDNQNKFNNPARVKESIENHLQTLKRYNIEGGFWGRITARLYAQAMRSVIMISPVLSFRNTFQNAAFEHDKSILFDPRNEQLTDKDVAYLETYVQQQRAMIEEYFMIGEKPVPGLKAISRLAEKVKMYPASDVFNRRWSFWAKINQVRRALKKPTPEMMVDAKFSDMTDHEQRMALSILAKDGKQAMARFVARVHVADIHFLYERAQRAPVEMGGGLARVYGNLMLFPRAYGEKLAKQINKFMTSKTQAEQWRALKVIMAVIGGGMVAGAMYKKITGRKRNPYNPFVILSWRPGGLAQGAIDAAGETYSNMVQGAGGDKKSQAAFLNSLPGLADMFIPFYDISLRGIEAVTDQKNIDYKFVRQMREAIDKEYRVRGGAYKVRRNAIERWQYFIGGAGVDQKAKTKKAKKIIR